MLFSSFETSATTASVDKNKLDTLAAFCNAERVTLAGSTIPAFIISTHSSVAALNPKPISTSFNLATITLLSKPAFSAICRTGASKAFLIILIPVCSSPVASSFSTSDITCTKNLAET